MKVQEHGMTPGNMKDNFWNETCNLKNMEYLNLNTMKAAHAGVLMYTYYFKWLNTYQKHSA